MSPEGLNTGTLTDRSIYVLFIVQIINKTKRINSQDVPADLNCVCVCVCVWGGGYCEAGTSISVSGLNNSLPTLYPPGLPGLSSSRVSSGTGNR